MSDIREGDVVVRLTPRIRIHAGERGHLPIRKGGIYRVQCWHQCADGSWGILLEGEHPHTCDCCDGTASWIPSHFRKVEAADEQFSDRIRKCRPVPAKVEETALDRLAARLGEGRMSPEVMVDLGIITDRDAAYGRMIEAAIARDDAGYERAKAEFWGRGL